MFKVTSIYTYRATIYTGLHRCNVSMQERSREDVSDGISWYCPRCYTRKSIRDGSFFAKSKLSLQKWLLLLHYWVRQTPVTEAMDDAEVNKRTAIDEYQWFREICSSALMRAPQIVLGGPGVIVHIDESLFRHKPKVVINKMRIFISLLFFVEQPGSSNHSRGMGVWACGYIPHTLLGIYGGSSTARCSHTAAYYQCSHSTWFSYTL